MIDVIALVEITVVVADSSDVKVPVRLESVEPDTTKGRALFPGT